MGNIGPVREQYEVLPGERESVPQPVAVPSRPAVKAFPGGRRENWLTRTVRNATR